MLDSLPPGTQQDTNLVSFKVYVNGSPISNEILVTQIIVNKSFNKIASAKVVLLDGSLPDRDFPLSAESLFKPGNEISIELGYQGNTETVFEGIIVKHGIKALQQGHAVLMLEAKDKAVKLTMARKNRYFINKTDKEAIEELAGALQPDVESTTVAHKQLVQFDATDWDFMLTRAEANGMLVFTDDGKLIVKKPATSSSPVLTATYGDNIYEFEAEMDARRQITAVTSQSWDFTKQEVEASGNGSSSFADNGNISPDELAGVLQGELLLNHSGHLSQDQLQDWSDAYAMRNRLSKITGRVRLEGNAALKPGTVITLDGVGDRFNGDVFVTGVLHQFDGNWHSDVQFGWQEDWFYKKENVMDKPASGLLPGVNGLQIGVVLDIDDQEDGGQYRVKVHVPLVNTGNEGIWARVATLDAGPDRGVYFRPQPQDEVILGFLNDDPRDAVILGCLHSKDSHKSPLPEQQGAEQYGIVTKENVKLIFDDTNKRLTMSVKTSSGEKSVVLNNDAGALEIKDENQNKISMDSSGITISAGAGNVTIKGLQVLIN
ncbi:Rhs element Vgr protein [Chitinophaga jiangningensis]|uniref:Rhs element Vgr protein n=1 Tax=Chitinophaga jiangningensis TaxID=1419482 RepID=A0A1M7JVB0_9BACT|nr:type VI secretion system tip protein VgrG [Chitinophaga jiangningensis]SHM56938.1 Rhs element Vgr protein [Chitinophaga jiangningensis]